MPRVRGNAAFTPHEVARIKRDLLEGISRKAIARRMGCGLETIARMARGDTWADVLPAAGAHIDELEAELLAPSNLKGIAERLIALQGEVKNTCMYCKQGVPINPLTRAHILPGGEDYCSNQGDAHV